MGLSIEVGNFQGPTTASPTTVTVDTGLGVEIKALILFGTDQTAFGLGDRVGSQTKGYLGFTDGTNEVCGGFMTEGSNSGENWVSATKCLVIYDAGGSVLFDADIVSFGTGANAGKFTLSFTTVTASAQIRIHYMALAGTDITNVLVGSRVMTAATETFSSLGFDPDCILCVSGPQSASLGSWDRKSFAAGAGISPTNRMGFGGRFRNANATNSSSGTYTTELVTTHDTGPTKDTNYDIQAMTATGGGFVLDRTVGANNVPFGFMMLKGIQVITGSIIQPTSAGTVESSSLGFAPLGVMVMGSDSDALNTNEGDAEFCIGAMAGATEEGAVWFGAKEQDANVDSASESTRVLISRDAGAVPAAIDADAEFSAFGADTFTMNWTTADATQRDYVWIAFGASAAAPGVTGGAYYQYYYNHLVAA